MNGKKNDGSRKGKLIAIEGIDGAGTTTQTVIIARWLKRFCTMVHRTSEPSRGPLGKYIRHLLKNKKASKEQLALLFAADRLDHIERKVMPALKRGAWIVTDRYRLSSLAYQGAECDPRWVRAINKHAPIADLTILIDLPVKTALKRIKSRGATRERFESQKQLEKIRKKYLELAKKKSEGRVVIVDGSPSAKDVTLKIKEAIQSFV